MERYDFRTKRLFTEIALSADARIAVEPGQANYLLNVLRMKPGDHVLLFNGRDGEWLAEIETARRKECRVRARRQTRQQDAPGDLWYLFAPLKQARLDYMVQKAVEMGASVLAPVITRHTQVNRVNIERMQANAVEAAEQCGILSLPEIREPMKFETVVGDWPQARQLIFCDELADQDNPFDATRPLAGKPLAVMIGPEGGFAQEEREALRALPFVTAIALGPRILRADTAAVAALAVVQAAAGDWRQSGM